MSNEYLKRILLKAWVRLNEENTAKDVLEKVLAVDDGKLIIEDREIISRVVEGDEETRFWKEIYEKRTARVRPKRKRDQSKEKKLSKKVKD